ncbi:MFS sugar transporter-like protein [Aulographum hederae CBS 113979]|uniref:MFS sugar transporter-like protein n=1 Tax=Aulographum hederae CBS 113979 TaxID=1176131 RepID=A0A6G1GLT2_9PEZI|nr:MFS sugar transporter-like protein [Aulographum hederae CBS 113979]
MTAASSVNTLKSACVARADPGSGGVLTLDSYKHDYKYPTTDQTRVNSLAVGLQQAGAFAACLVAWPISDKLGRRKALMISSFVFCVGALIETSNTHSLAAFYVGRVIAGLGLGAASTVTPVYISEMAPKELRARIGSFFQFFFTIGIFTSYWIDYGMDEVYGNALISRQWQIPIGLQLVPAGLLGFGTITLKESVRWLTKKGRHDEAWDSLRWIRADGSRATRDEMEEIREGAAREALVTADFHIKELIQPTNLPLTATAFLVFLAQQATGATAFAYFGPQYFKLLVGNSTHTALLLTAIFGAIKVAACGFFVWFLAERITRRHVLIYGAFIMAACQITTAAVVKAKPPPEDGGITSAGIATVALIYLFVIMYNLSWGPLPWPYVSEIFPARIRDPGTAVGVASQWLFNLVFSLTTPYMIENLGWGTFLLWGAFDVVIGTAAALWLNETSGKSLEEIAKRRIRGGGDRESPSDGRFEGGMTGDVDVAPVK